MLWEEAQEAGHYGLPESQDHPEFVPEFVNYLIKNKKIRKGSHNPERDQEILVAFIEDGGIRPRQLARKYGISRQAASKLLARLKPALIRLYLDYNAARKASSNSSLYPCPHVQTEPLSEAVADLRGAS
ncbi:MarR family transcriptional regulator [Acidithiobacillus marinus]|nr:helix-turn-helix domain-containing protein [Acidithiobacillus marinus]